LSPAAPVLSPPEARPRPFVKWAGGKGQLLPHLQPWLQARCSRYVEPFLGGGAVFFHLRPGRALLGDSNARLVETYEMVRDRPSDLMALLDQHQAHASNADYYYEVRSQQTEELSPTERAARFIFLNKTCYNGLYRVNRRGQFNVPFGRYRTPPQLYDQDVLTAASLALQGAVLACQDFAATLAQVAESDLVYLDPPYDPLSPTANFTGYTARAFGRSEQQRLAEAFAAADGRGARLVLNNSDTPFIRDLYPSYRCIAVPGLRRAINSDATKRSGVTELVITNF